MKHTLRCIGRILQVAVLTAAVFLCAQPATAGPDNGLLVFSYNEEGFPPYLYREGNRITGITVEILREALKGIGFDLLITLEPEKRGHQQLVRGQVDARGKALEWVDNPGEFKWSQPFLEPSTVVISNADNPVTHDSLLNGHGLTIAAISGFCYPDLDRFQRLGRISRVNVHDVEKLLLLVHMKRVDGAIIDLFTARWLIQQNPDYSPEDFHITTPALSTVGYRLMFNRNMDWDPFIERFDAQIARMLAAGRIDAIIDNYR